MKTISIVIPTYNEEDNINLIYERVTGILKNNLSKYDYRILFIDNCSTDSSRTIIRTLGKRDSHVQYIFNIKNFGNLYKDIIKIGFYYDFFTLKVQLQIAGIQNGREIRC